MSTRAGGQLIKDVHVLLVPTLLDATTNKRLVLFY
jgi:hypothetical protein